MRLMIQMWLRMLGEYGWHTPVDELTYITTAQDTEYLKPVYVQNEIIKRESRAVGFKILGTFLTSNNRQDREVAHRTACAWASF